MISVKRNDHLRISAMQMAMHWHGMDSVKPSPDLSKMFGDPASPNFDAIFRTYEKIYMRLLDDTTKDDLA